MKKKGGKRRNNAESRSKEPRSALKVWVNLFLDKLGINRGQSPGKTIATKASIPSPQSGTKAELCTIAPGQGTLYGALIKAPSTPPAHSMRPIWAT